MNTPVLLLIYNRPLKTKRVFAAIRQAKPAKLFIAADGPLDLDDDLLCVESRKLTENIDWDCDVKRLYRPNNLGLKKAIGEALTWFFENVEEGIILEDDCLPEESFFDFCMQMLNRYRNDTRVMLIRGDNPVGNMSSKSGNYYLSQYIGMWGWATWRRAWNLYDRLLRDWQNPKVRAEVLSRFDNFWEKIYWGILLDATFNNKTNSWGYRWMYSVWKNNGSIVIPCVNLVKNIGFKGRKTHFVIRSFERRIEKIQKPYVEIKDRSFISKSDKKISKTFYGVGPLMDLAQYLYYLVK